MLSFDTLVLILSYLKRHQTLRLNLICKHFNSFYNSEEYRTFLISEIHMDLNFEQYSLMALKNIFLMTKKRCLCGNFLIHGGKLYRVNSEKLILLSDIEYFTAINDGEYILDEKGYIHRINFFTGDIKRITGIKGITSLLGGYKSIPIKTVIHFALIIAQVNSN